MSTINSKTVRIAIASSCNLRCIYCEGSAGYKPYSPGAMEDFRKKPLGEGNIGTQVVIDIVNVFRQVGFGGIALTGGEPLLNPRWDLIVNEATRMGMERVELTTNGILLDTYLERKGKLPDGLSLVKVSFDTSDPFKFREITRGGNVEKVVNAVKAISSQIKTRANKVVLQSDIGNLIAYLDSCQKIGFHEVNLMNLSIHPDHESQNEITFFEREYVFVPKLLDYLSSQLGILFKLNNYRYVAKLSNGFHIIVRDNNISMRDAQCLSCPAFCQEGRNSVRLATDGNITTCLDYKGELPSIDGVKELKQGTLSNKMSELAFVLDSATQMNTFKKFLKFYNLFLRDKI